MSNEQLDERRLSVTSFIPSGRTYYIFMGLVWITNWFCSSPTRERHEGIYESPVGE